MDEISICAPTHVAELNGGEISAYTISPQDFNLETARLEDISIENTGQSLALMKSVLDDEEGAAKDIVLLNAGAAIYAAGLAGELAGGLELARKSISSGSARQKLEDLAKLTNSFQD